MSVSGQILGIEVYSMDYWIRIIMIASFGSGQNQRVMINVQMS